MVHEGKRAPTIPALSSIVGLVGVVAIYINAGQSPLFLSVAIQREGCQLTTLCSCISFARARQRNSLPGRF